MHNFSLHVTKNLTDKQVRGFLHHYADIIYTYYFTKGSGFYRQPAVCSGDKEYSILKGVFGSGSLALLTSTFL